MSDQYAKPTAQTFISGEPGTTGREPFDEYAKPAHGQGQHNLGQGHGATGTGAGLAGVGAGAAGAGLTGQHSHHDHHSGSTTGAGLTGAHSHQDHHSGAQAGQTGQTGASRIAEDTAGTGSTGINKERTGHGAGAAGAAGAGAAAAGAAGHHHGDSHNNNNNNLNETDSSTTGGGIDPNVKGSDGFFKEIDPKHPMNHHDDKDFHPHGSSGAGGHSHNDRVGSQNQEGHKYESTGASGPTTSGAAGTDRFDSSRDQSSHSGTQEGFRDVSQRGSDRSTGGTGGVGALGTTDKDFTGRDRIADRGAYNDSDGHFKHNTDGPGGNNALTGREGDVSKNPVAQSDNAGPASGEQVGNTAHPEHHKGLVEKVKDALHK